MPIKTFRGKIASGDTDTIILHTNDGSIGYRIVKFEMLTPNPGTTNYEHIMKIWKTPGQTANETIDFSNNQLLAAGFSEGQGTSQDTGNTLSVIFDTEIFNQEIYITQIDTKGALSCNYYIELEQIKLDLNDNTVATLKDIRNIKSPT